MFCVNKALGIEQSSYPPFGAMIIFELWDCNSELKIKVFNINETEGGLGGLPSMPIGGKQVKPSFCPHHDCPYEVFVSAISKFFPNWIKDCGIPPDYDYYSANEGNLTNTLD